MTLISDCWYVDSQTRMTRERATAKRADSNDDDKMDDGLTHLLVRFFYSSFFSQDDTDYKVTVLRQKMLGMFPVFMYRVKEKQPGQEYL